jgi:zinc protease
MNEMREKRGLNYGDYAYVENFVQSGGSRDALTNIARRRQHFEIWLRPVDPKDAVFSIRLARFLLDGMLESGIDDKALDETRTFLEGYTRLRELTPMRRLGHALDDQFYGTDKYLDDYRSTLKTMTADSVNGALQKHLGPKGRPLAIAIGAPDAEQLKAALLSGAPTPKVYETQVPEDISSLDAKMVGLPLGIAPENIRVIPVDELFVK